MQSYHEAAHLKRQQNQAPASHSPQNHGVLLRARTSVMAAPNLAYSPSATIVPDRYLENYQGRPFEAVNRSR